MFITGENGSNLGDSPKDTGERRRKGEKDYKPEPNCCPRCKSVEPHLHPAVQSGGEVHMCPDNFHLRETPQNKESYRQQVRDEQARRVPLG